MVELSSSSTGSSAQRQAEIEDERRRAREQAEQSLFSLFNPFNWGIGGMLLMGLIGFGIYYLGFTDRGREMMGNFFNGLSPEWQQRLAGWGASLGLLPDGLDGQSASALMEIGRRHGVTGFSVENYLQPDIMYDAMIQQPQAVLGLARGLPRGGNGTNAMTQRAMGAVRQIINNPQRLNTLLNDTNRANTYALLEALSPIPVTQGALGTFIDAVGMQNGRPKPEFVRFLNGMLGDDAAARNTAMLQFLNQVAQSNPQALQALARSVNLEQVQDEALRGQIQTLQQLAGSETTMRSGLRTETTLRQQGTSSEELLNQMSTITGMVNLFTNPAQLAQIQPVMQDLGVMANAEAGRARAGSPAHTILSFLGTGQTINGQQGRAVNMLAIHHFFDTIARNPENGAGATPQNPAAMAKLERTRHVMAGMMVMMGLQPVEGERIPPLNPREVAAFFRNEANVRAFDTLLREINPGRLPPAMREAITSLRANWAPRGGADTSYTDNGLAEVFASPLSIQYLLTHGGGGSAPSTNSVVNWFEEQYARYMPTRISGLPQAIRDNVDYLIPVRNALANVGVSLDTPAAAPANRPGAPAPARS